MKTNSLNTNNNLFEKSEIKKIWETKDLSHLQKIGNIGAYLFSREKKLFIEKQDYRYFPHFGIECGLIAGIFHRLHKNISPSIKFNCAHLKDSFFLPAINEIKQWELKHFALLPLTALFTYNVIAAFRKISSETPLKERIVQSIKEQISIKGLLSFSTVAVLALGNPLYCRSLGICSTEGFDSSGHLMMEVALAPSMANALKTTGKNNVQLAIVAGAVYAMTSAILIHNTTDFCHSLPETIAGIAWGASIIALSRAVQSLVVHKD